MATETKVGHTRGPWDIPDFQRVKRPVQLSITAGNKFVVHMVFYGDGGRPTLLTDEDRANIVLMAAAPDLLAACVEAEVMLRGALAIAPEKRVVSAVLAQAQAAIAKARGGA